MVSRKQESMCMRLSKVHWSLSGGREHVWLMEFLTDVTFGRYHIHPRVLSFQNWNICYKPLFCTLRLYTLLYTFLYTWTRHRCILASMHAYKHWLSFIHIYVFFPWIYISYEYGIYFFHGYIFHMKMLWSMDISSRSESTYYCW